MTDSPQSITREAFRSLRHPIQRRRFALALFFALILFPLIAAGLAAGTIVLIVPLFAFLLWVTGRVLFARFMGNGILVSEMNYPRIHRIGEDLKTRIGYKKTVNIFVYEHGNFNAYLVKFFFYRRAVFLNSELLEAGVTDDELRWLIGRFIGYLRARREAGFWGWTIRASQQMLVFNLFLLPYERALVYSGDRIALAVIDGDITSAISAMQKLFVGRQLGYSVNPSGLVDQHRKVKGSIFAFLARLGMGFPHLTARYVDLIGFAKETYPAQYARFEAENPGLPADITALGGLPGARPSTHGDPVVGSLIAALIVLALTGLLTWKVIIPRLNHPTPSPDASLFQSPAEDASILQSTYGTQQTPPAADTPSTQATQSPAYSSTEGRFSIAFPGSPTQSSQQVNLPGGDSMTVYQTTYSEDNNTSYMVSYNDYPQQYLGAGAQSILEHARDGVVESVKGTLVNDEAIDLNSVPGRAYTFTDTSGDNCTAREFLDGQRLYLVLVVSGKGSSSTQADDFLSSFRIH